MQRQERFESVPIENCFEELNRQRGIRRIEYEQHVALNPSAEFIGTCQEMCPEYERHEREAHLDVSPFEALPTIEFNNGSTRINHQRAVKKYHRPAAGNEAPLPEDVRPLPVLATTMNYLLDEVLDRMNNAPFKDKHKFVRDRTRAIRQDIILQQRAVYSNYEWLQIAVQLHEEMARFHILSGHRLGDLDISEFDPFQNTEQLRKVLQSLQEYYNDIRKLLGSGKDSGNPILLQTLKNESEFRGYMLLTHAEDQEVFHRVLSFPPEIFASAKVQYSISSLSALHRGDYIKYFNAAKQGNYFQACLLHTHFTKMRSKAMQIIQKAYLSREDLDAQKVAEWLCIEEFGELEEILRIANWSVIRGQIGGRPLMRLPSTPNDNFNDEINTIKPKMSQFIENKSSNCLVSHLLRSSSVDEGMAPMKSLPNTQKQLLFTPSPPVKRDTRIIKQVAANLILSNLLSWFKQETISSLVDLKCSDARKKRAEWIKSVLQRVAKESVQRFIQESIQSCSIFYLEERKQRLAISNFRIEVLKKMLPVITRRILDSVIKEAVRSIRRAKRPLKAPITESFAVEEVEEVDIVKQNNVKRIKTMDTLPRLKDHMQPLQDAVLHSKGLLNNIENLLQSIELERQESNRLDELLKHFVK